mmetsp:Transcript_10373/g.11959  ORF Transcript_10373/g.11959 Transcript_10373/m.11959 type:complete len:653 (+) Transcript_10373:242-2200(+)
MEVNFDVLDFPIGHGDDVSVAKGINILHRKSQRIELFEYHAIDEQQWLRVLLQNHFLFKGFNAHDIYEVASKMVKLNLSKGQLLIQQGAPGEQLYACQSGILHVVQEGLETVVDELSPGRILGELGFLFSSQRAASVICAGEENVIWELSKKNISQKHLARLGGNLESRMKVLLHCQVFENLDIKKLRRAAAVMEEEYYRNGDTICLQGDLPVEGVNDKFYAIASGEVDVSVGMKDGTITTVAHLGVGEWFGEIALLQNSARTATVTSVNDNTMCYTLSKSAFIQVVSTTIRVIRGIATRSEMRNMNTSEIYHRHQRDQGAEYIQLENLISHAIIGEGGFSLVRMVEDRSTGYIHALKVMNKHDITVRKQQDHVNNERSILDSLSHPFIMSLIKTFQDENRLFMLLELVQGGELFSRVCNSGGLSSKSAQFYAACVTEGISYLHRKHIVYRDLKLENLVIAADGYLKIIDFGFAKILQPGERAHTLCGTPDYLSPETVLRKGHWHPTDLWSIGVLVYEMLTQCSPFASSSSSNSQEETFRNILRGHEAVDWFQLRQVFSSNDQFQVARRMLQRLWDPNPATRITCNGLKLHPFFISSISWEKLRNQAYEPPWLPQLSGPTDTRHFEVQAFAAKQESGALYIPPPSGNPFAHW